MSWRITLAAVLLMLGSACGETDECGELKNACDNCTGAVREACMNIVNQGDPELCDASWKAYRKACPTWEW